MGETMRDLPLCLIGILILSTLILSTTNAEPLENIHHEHVEEPDWH